VRYLAPARFADVLRVHLRCVGVRGARFRFEYAIERAADAVVVADGWTNHACVDAATLRPTRLPAWLVEAIARTEAAAP
jgi:acyl-CoA thioester hydrolase